MARRGNTSVHSIVGVLATLLLAAFPRGTGAQRPPDPAAALERAAQFVVMIRGVIGDAPTVGAGIIVGLGTNRVYVVTANHVVRRGQGQAKNLQVQLKWLPGEWQSAVVLEHSDMTFDLAVIAVPDARLPRLNWQALMRPDALVRGTKVFPIGYPGGNAWFLAVNPHLVSMVATTTIRTEGNLVDGHSGGALVTEDGAIVGLVSSVDPVAGESQRIDRVMDKLAEWGYRTSLTWRPAGGTGSTATGAATTGEVVTIRTDGRSRSYDFRTKRLGEGPTGGDFYFSGTYPGFIANNRGQRGVVDLGEVAVPLSQVEPPASGFTQQNVNAVTGRTYAALASEEHAGDVIVFRVLDIGYRGGTTEFYRIEYSYRSRGGDRTEKVIVPNVVGGPFEEARRQLVDAGLSTGSVERHALRRYASGTVYNQTPAAGAQVNRGDTVKLYLDVTPPPEYQAMGAMTLKPSFVFDLDWDPADRGGRTSHDFRFGTERGWQLQPENGAQIAEVPAPRGALTAKHCMDARLSKEPVNLTFRTSQMYFCVLTNRGRLAFMRVSKHGDDEIAVGYSTWKSEASR